jgi:putative addiction module CopG family antidote
MGTVRKTITLTEQQDDWIKARIHAGHYTNDSECLRDLIRREQQRDADLEAIWLCTRSAWGRAQADRYIDLLGSKVPASSLCGFCTTAWTPLAISDPQPLAPVRQSRDRAPGAPSACPPASSSIPRPTPPPAPG